MEELKNMKKQLMAAAQSQMGNLKDADAEELGEVIDMIKDLEEAMYYCSIVKAMEDSKEEKKDNQKYNDIMTSLLSRVNNQNQEPEQRYYTQPYYPMWEDPREISPYMKRNTARINYYGGDGQSGNNGSSQGNIGAVRGYDEISRQMNRDPREGNSGRYRRGYVEGKENHQDKNTQMQGLEDYMRELSSDITDMIRGASQEEKIILQQRLSSLADKVINA